MDITQRSDMDGSGEEPEYPKHEIELTSCAKWVALSTWMAAARAANGDRSPSLDARTQVERLIEQTDFIRLALYRHNWRNIHAVLTAFHDAGTAESPDVLSFYEHQNRIPSDQRQPPHPDPTKRAPSAEGGL